MKFRNPVKAPNTASMNTTTVRQIEVSSPAFKMGEMIPRKYSCEGININPALQLDNIPAKSKSLALIVDDPDAPISTWVHWLVWNIPVSKTIGEDQIPGMEGMNDFQKHHYGGPCPPAGVHRYYFKVYALDCLLDLPDSTRKFQLERELSGHVIGYGELMGLYERNS